MAALFLYDVKIEVVTAEINAWSTACQSWAKCSFCSLNSIDCKTVKLRGFLGIIQSNDIHTVLCVKFWKIQNVSPLIVTLSLMYQSEQYNQWNLLIMVPLLAGHLSFRPENSEICARNGYAVLCDHFSCTGTFCALLYYHGLYKCKVIGKWKMMRNVFFQQKIELNGYEDFHSVFCGKEIQKVCVWN